MKVLIPTPLRSYTHHRSEVEAAGEKLGQVLVDLNRQFPGFRFRIVDEQDRIRAHIKIFIGQELEEDLSRSVKENDTVQIICSLSGG